MREAVLALLNNPAFWVFLGTVVTSFFGYKQVVKKSPQGRAKATVRNATSFEELRSVVEVLQGELLKKDKRHKDDTDYMLTQLTEARSEVRSLGGQLAEALKKLAKSEQSAETCSSEVSRLQDILRTHGIIE